MPENSNANLARLLDRRADGHEPAPEASLTALSGGGVFIPVTSAGTVLFLPDNEQPPTLLGFTDAALGARLLPGAAGMVHCDVARLRDILARTGVGLLGVRSDTVHQDALSGEVRVVSRAYDAAPQGPARDAPPPASASGAAPEKPAHGAAPRPRTGRRWFGASS